ncbi:AcrR family transcriptional regulator [Amycolatopsis bartoniae]|uniref:TetR family transcriptional regulator n=1 Tax=Amycolatopsis bartoniae TaxID=941986 RepID=A0A8H9MEX7_9PSEU|nr:TetR/AcrR family transcriptional regulator [Amycolatopsis bartoniae]MBB2938945.1 AcrR family transcriptional regulator [Amycolatopsis bartoniae]GHF66007.1 TetR family transcriptional regulator [Amycolatopsis bartoniae]
MLTAARKQLRATGEAPPMKELARLAGVGVGTVYRHFPTQQALLEALGVDGMRRLVAACEAAAGNPDPVAGFERITEFVLRGQLSDPGVAAVLAAGQACGEASPLAARLGAAVDEVLGRARAAGAIRPEVSADDIRRLLVGTAYALRPVPDEPRIRLYLTLFLDGLRPRGKTGRVADADRP